MLLEALAAKGLSILANAIMAKGKEVIEEKIGMKIPENPSDKDLIELKIKTMEHEEELVRLAIEKEKLSLEEIKIDNANTDSARNMNANIQGSQFASSLAKNTAYFIDILIVASTLIVAGLLIFVDISVSNKEIAFAAMGSLMTLCGTVVNFHRGSSSSSKSKDETIKMLKGG